MIKNIKLPIRNKSLIRPFSVDSKPRDESSMWLDKNENLDPALKRIIKKISEDVSLLSFSSYPEASELYSKLSKWLKISKKSIILTHGSDGGIRATFDLFVESGDIVLHMSPTFAMYPIYCKIYGANQKTINYSRKNDKPYVSLKEIIIQINKNKPKLFCFANPDSPTGNLFKKKELIKIIQCCKQNNTIVLIDEAYHPFSNITAINLLKDFDNLLVARTFSKAWGLAGLRLGYISSSREIIKFLNKIRPMYEVSTFSINFATRMMDYKQEMYNSVKRLKEGKIFFASEMKKLGFNVINCEGNFIHIDFKEFKKDIHNKLKGKILYRLDFKENCLAGYSRFSATTIDQYKYLIGLIKSVVLK